jgi:wyosine [tRNA(Phe)-imidazoG37] synthetase (radical SAM superfamily)
MLHRENEQGEDSDKFLHVFGPVPSRRLGLSLGIDLIPAKTCTYDCLYCQVGRTTCKTTTRKPFVAVQAVVNELKRKLRTTNPDTLTLAGSGEPTLHSRIGEVITEIKKITDIPIALLTNGSLLWRAEVREQALGADIILPTLSTVFDETYETIHRPHSDLDVQRINEGFINLRQEYTGQLFLEVVLLRGLNESDEEIEGLKQMIERIYPDKIQLNTVVRPPADPRARQLDRGTLERVKNLLGDRAEVIAEIPVKPHQARFDSLEGPILEMTRRRPMRALDIANIVDRPLEEVEKVIRQLVKKGFLGEQGHGQEVYYSDKSE